MTDAEIQALFPDHRYSYALPKSWALECARKGFDVTGHFVWLFDDPVGRPAPITEQGEVMLSKLCRDLKYVQQIRDRTLK
jgi:hypothetical protein